MQYELIKPDPFYRGKVANRQAIKLKRINYLSNRPVWIAPLLTLFFVMVYKAYWTLFKGVVWVGEAVGKELRYLASK